MYFSSVTIVLMNQEVVMGGTWSAQDDILMEVESLGRNMGRNDLGDMDLKHPTKIGFEAVKKIELV